MQLSEKYRPKVWSDVVGQEKAVRLANAMISASGFDRGAFWIGASGANNSGLGKSSLAWVMANALADDFFISVLKGRNVDAACVRDMEASANLCTWCAARPYRVWIIEEAHQMTAGAVDLMLSFLEPLPKHCVVIFTSTRSIDVDLFGQDAGPFGSRVTLLQLTNRGVAEPLARRLAWIAEQEGIPADYDTCFKLIREAGNNMREAIQQLSQIGILASVAA